jgi:hypothetical protein
MSQNTGCSNASDDSLAENRLIACLNRISLACRQFLDAVRSIPSDDAPHDDPPWPSVDIRDIAEAADHLKRHVGAATANRLTSLHRNLILSVRDVFLPAAAQDLPAETIDLWRQLFGHFPERTDDTTVTTLALAGTVSKLRDFCDEVAHAIFQLPALSDRQYLILQTLLMMRATSANNRQTTAIIAAKAEGTRANPVQFKQNIAILKHAGFLSTKEGRGGGCWLTAKGQEVARNLAHDA